MKSNHSKSFIARNAKFKAATKAEKRVMLARDVIKQIKCEKYIPSIGDWISIRNKEGYSSFTNCNGKEEILDLIEEKGATCEICALGSLMCSMVRVKDKLKAEDRRYLDYNRLVENYPLKDKIGIKDLFGKRQLQLIEIAYERGRGLYEEPWESSVKEFEVDFDKDDDAADARAFGRKFDSNEERLLAIMDSIIKNKGLFVPI